MFLHKYLEGPYYTYIMQSRNRSTRYPPDPLRVWENTVRSLLFKDHNGPGVPGRIGNGKQKGVLYSDIAPTTENPYKSTIPTRTAAPTEIPASSSYLRDGCCLVTSIDENKMNIIIEFSQ
jgi:hypothetical protein